jgi:hypothetical protein
VTRWLVCLLCACNQAYGLDGTRSVDPDKDRDHDGIEDGDDNCPDLANNDQDDRDHDDIGDACDHCDACAPCERAVNHDEDGDQIDDGCDNCPALSNPRQENLDGDDAGDVCDVDNAVAHHRVFFDGFATLSEAWLQGGAAWKIVDDSATPAPGLASPPYRLQRAGLDVTADARWQIEIGITPGTVGGGIYLPSTTGQLTVHCALIAMFPGPQWQMVSGTGAGSGAFEVRPNMRLRLSLDGASVRCDLIGVHLRDSTLTTLLYPYNLDLHTTGEFTFAYIDVLRP